MSNINPISHNTKIVLTLPQAIQQATTAYENRDWKKAEQLFRLVLKVKPNYFDALNYLGIILAQTQRLEEAADLFGRAVAVGPENAVAHNNYGNILKDLKYFDKALHSYNCALKIKPNYVEAYCNRANLLHDLERFDEALDNYNYALKIKPDYIDAYINRGVILKKLNRFDEALESYNQALKINSKHAEVYIKRGVVLHDLKCFDEALKSYDDALKLSPDHAKVYNNRGNILHDLQRCDEALESYDYALKLKPDYAEAYNNRGVMLRTFKRFHEALESYDHALKITPDYVEVYYNRGNVLHDLKRFEEALKSYDDALKLKSDYVDSYFNRGNTLSSLQRFEEALKSYDDALKLKPDYIDVYVNRGNIFKDLKRFEDALNNYNHVLKINPDYDFLYGAWLHTKMYICDWSDIYIYNQFSIFVEKVESNKKITPFHLVAIPNITPQHQYRVAQLYALSRIKNELMIATPTPTPTIKTDNRHQKLRIGYLSADFHTHATVHLLAGVLENRNSQDFTVYLYSYGIATKDDLRLRMENACEVFRNVFTSTDDEIAKQILMDEIDILVDLKGYTKNERVGITALRPAPVIINWLGYPGTLGHKRLANYIIGDPIVTPLNHAEHFSETLALMPHCYQPNDNKRPIGKCPSREEIGLPITGFVFCSFNQSYKITPEMFTLWCRLLAAVPGSVLWMLQPSPAAQRNLQKEMQIRGIDSSRLIFATQLGQTEHLGRLQLADLGIDTFPCTSHTTASDMLWAGIPLVTKMGETFASRVAASILSAMDLAELVTTSNEDYFNVAVDLATNPLRLLAIKQKIHIQKQTSPLFDTQRFAYDLECLYQAIFTQELAGERKIIVFES